MSHELSDLARHIPNGIVKLSDFEKKQELGAGAFGKVTRAIHRKSGKEVAIKELFMDDALDEEVVLDYVHEVEMLWKCRYHFVLPLLGFTVKEPYAIVMPYLSHGSLWDYVREDNPIGRLDATQKTLIAIGIAYGMSHLHEANIVHRDLKSMNILLDDRMLPFICDFGIAKTCEGKNTFMTRECGSTLWMAPEQMNSHHYDGKVDVYSYAVILYEMLCEHLPFEGLDRMQVMVKVSDGKRPKLPSKEKAVCSLIKSCWEQDPKKRPPFKKIYKKLIKGDHNWEGTNPKAIKAIKMLIKSAKEQREKMEKEAKEHHKK